MPRTKRAVKTVDTLWIIPDDLWPTLDAILQEFYPPARTGRPRGSFRPILDGILYRLRTGVQWNALPRQFGSDTTVHDWFQRFVADGVFERLWAVLIDACDELGGVSRTWQAADGVVNKARLGGGLRRQKPDRPGQAGDQAGDPGRGVGRPARDDRRGGQRPRLDAHPGGDRVGGDRAARSGPGPAAPVFGQGLRHARRAGGGRECGVRTPHPTDRRGDEAVRPPDGAQAAAVGGRADHCLAQSLSGHPGALRQEGGELPRADATGVCPHLVAKAL